MAGGPSAPSLEVLPLVMLMRAVPHQPVPEFLPGLLPSAPFSEIQSVGKPLQCGWCAGSLPATIGGTDLTVVPAKQLQCWSQTVRLNLVILIIIVLNFLLSIMSVVFILMAIGWFLRSQRIKLRFLFLKRKEILRFSGQEESTVIKIHDLGHPVIRKANRSP